MSNCVEENVFLYILDRIKWISLLFLMAGIPLIINPTAYDYWYKPKVDSLYALIITIFLACLLQVVFFNAGFKIRKTCLIIPLILYLLSACISTILSISPELSLKGDVLRYESIFTLFSYVALVILFSSLFVKEAQFHAIIKTLLVSTALVSIYATIQYAGFNPTEHFIASFRQTEHRVGSTIGNPNFLGKFLVLVLPLYIAYFINTNSKIKKAFFASGFLFSVLALIFTFTRSSWLGFATSLAVLFFILPVKKLFVERFKKMFIAFAIIMFAAFCFGLFFAEDNRKENDAFFPKLKYKIRSSFDFEKGMGVATRLFVWKKTVGVIKDRPIFGYGPDAHVEAMRVFNLEYSRKFNNYVIIDRAHNNYLDITVGQGLFGLGAYLSIIVTFMVWLWKTMKQEQDRSRKIICCCLFSAFFGYLINDLFIFSVVSVSPTFWSLLGLTLTLKKTQVVRQIS